MDSLSKRELSELIWSSAKQNVEDHHSFGSIRTKLHDKYDSKIGMYQFT